MLKASQCESLIAHSPEQYVAIADRLANDTEQLLFLRKNLRQMTFDGGFSNAQAFAKKFDHAFDTMLTNAQTHIL